MAMNTRSQLGPLMNAVCFQYLRINTEDVAGRAPIVAAGYKRGQDVAEGLGLRGKVSDPSAMRDLLDSVLGTDGTRLCLVTSISALDDESFEVRITEGACTMGQTADEPICAFTLGVIVGAISTLLDRRMIGKEQACQACGAPMCVYHVRPV
jgi:predicted hydrocarbon binding protein